MLDVRSMMAACLLDAKSEMNASLIYFRIQHKIMFVCLVEKIFKEQISDNIKNGGRVIS